jgi:hypothetical protein
MPPPGRSSASRRISGFFLRFSLRQFTQFSHINGVS